MKRSIFILSLITAAGLFVIVACQNSSANPQSEVILSKDSLIKRGSYLVTVSGCDDCHSPKRFSANGVELIPELRLSGSQHNNTLPKVDKSQVKNGWVLLGGDFTAAVGPWGVSYAGNLTSDETGIGIWSEAQFSKALREGKLKGMDGTRPLLPSMPWENFRNFTDLDIKAIYTFLQSTKPVSNVVPAPKSLEEL
ncbi:MAG: diheme cytochrome c-553 [Chitinophagaceae bacterium]